MILKELIEINSDAITLRKYFGEDAYSPVDIFSIISNNDNFTTVFLPMSERISGICVRDVKNMIIAINSNVSRGRQRYTAAHELCHLFFHEDLEPVVCAMNIGQNKDPKEIEADKFASYFLAPYESLKNYIKDKLVKDKGTLDITDIVKIEQYYGLSRQAILWRLVNEGYLSHESAATMKTGVKASALKLGFDDSLYSALSKDKQYFTSGKYIKIAEELNEKDLVSTGKYNEFLLNAFRYDIVYGLNDEGEESYD